MHSGRVERKLRKSLNTRNPPRAPWEQTTDYAACTDKENLTTNLTNGTFEPTSGSWRVCRSRKARGGEIANPLRLEIQEASLHPTDEDYKTNNIPIPNRLQRFLISSAECRLNRRQQSQQREMMFSWIIWALETLLWRVGMQTDPFPAAGIRRMHAGVPTPSLPSRPSVLFCNSRTVSFASFPDSSTSMASQILQTAL